MALQKEQTLRLNLSLRYEKQAVDLQALLYKGREDANKAAEKHAVYLQAQQYKGNAEKEAEKLRKEWKDFCGTKKISLVKGDLIYGEVRFNNTQMDHAREIIRRSDPENPSLQDFIGRIRRPGLEYIDYPKPASTIRDVNKIHADLEMKSTVSGSAQS